MVNSMKEVCLGSGSVSTGAELAAVKNKLQITRPNKAQGERWGEG